LWTEINIKKHNFLIGNFYRPPSSNVSYFENIQSIIEKATYEDKTLIIAGDFNVDYKLNDDLYKNKIFYLESLFGLKQLVDFPTRVTIQSKTCIDLILSNNPDIHVHTKPWQIALSDHYMVYTSIKIDKTKLRNHNFVEFRNYKKFDVDKFMQDINASILTDPNEFDVNDIEKEWKKWKDKFLEISNAHAPIVKMRVSNKNNPWIDSEVNKMMYERDYCHKKATKSKDPALWEKYKEKRNNVTSIVRLKKKEYFNDQLSKSQSSKKMWNVLNTAMSKSKTQKRSIPPEMTPESFNKFYANIGINMAKKLKYKPLSWKNPECIHEFKFKTVERENVYKCLKTLPSRRNLDVLGCDSKLLKICANAISDTLCKLMNISLMSGIIPDDWKIGRITPVYKGDGDILVESNYRPISVIGHVAKLMELNVKNQFVSNLTEKRLITIDQSAYLKKHSTVTCLHRVIEEWREVISETKIWLVHAFLTYQNVSIQLIILFFSVNLKNMELRELKKTGLQVT
jgi:hypothetical protein